MKKIIVLIFILLNMSLLACSQSDKPTVNLYLAVKRGDIDQIKRHITWGTNINQINVDGQTPLHESAIKGRIFVTQLLLKNGAQVNKLNKKGETALFLALINGRTQLADVLISKFHARFNATDLLFAMVNHHISDRDVFEFLVAKGANINAFNEQGKTPLIIAIENQQRLVAKHLIANHADVNIASQQHQLPLTIAEKTKNTDLITLLKHNGAQKSHHP